MLLAKDKQKYPDLTACTSFKAFESLPPVDLKTIDEAFISKMTLKVGPFTYMYATSRISTEILTCFQQLADEAKAMEKYDRVLAGDMMNPGEKRKVSHHQTRSADRGFYGEQQARIAAFANQIRSGEIRTKTDSTFRTVVQIGIGGSDLGPRAMYIALERLFRQNPETLTAQFIANVDPDDANGVLGNLNLDETLFIVVSKSGTTQETLTNLDLVKSKLKASGFSDEDIRKHLIAVTGQGSPMDDASKYLDSFYIDDNIGGRYSCTSAVGGAVLSLAFGPDVFEEFISGAAEIDQIAQNPDVAQNGPLLAALIGVWWCNCQGYPTKGIIPYSEALSRFVAHLQQADCESNGKKTSIYDTPVPYATGPVIFGEPGTNSQHSFFQSMHQGAVAPIEFIGFKNPQIATQGNSQEILKANIMAQVMALAVGKEDPSLNETFHGNRPTTLLWADQLTAKTLGALLGWYENLIMFQGFLWNLNSFDQPGVQLGKLLAKQILAGNAPPALNALMSL